METKAKFLIALAFLIFGLCLVFLKDDLGPTFKAISDRLQSKQVIIDINEVGEQDIPFLTNKKVNTWKKGQNE